MSNIIECVNYYNQIPIYKLKQLCKNSYIDYKNCIKIQIINLLIKYNYNKFYNKLIKLQSYIKGYLCRKNRLPNILYTIQNYLKLTNYNCCNIYKDGRTNSIIDEKNILKILKIKFKNKIKICKERMWYDFLIYDYKYKWLPINLKTSALKSCDNSGNLTMCVYSYTNYKIEFNKFYNNKKLSNILIKNLKNNLNYNIKKDYYFLILNKNNNEIIINSLKGLSNLTSNINNFPFQINWNKNKVYKYDCLKNKIKLFINCFYKTKDWKYIFYKNIKKMKFI